MTLESADARPGFLVCVVFVIERDGEVLLLKRSHAKDHAPGEWETGSGGILSGEAPAAAVLREAKEETGLDVEVVGLVEAFHFYRGVERRETIGITFHCGARESVVTLSDEHEEAKWVPLDALDDQSYPGWLTRAARAIRARRERGASAAPSAGRT